MHFSLTPSPAVHALQPASLAMWHCSTQDRHEDTIPMTHLLLLTGAMPGHGSQAGCSPFWDMTSLSSQNRTSYQGRAAGRPCCHMRAVLPPRCCRAGLSQAGQWTKHQRGPNGPHQGSEGSLCGACPEWRCKGPGSL